MLWVSFELPWWGDSKEYPQHMFLWRAVQNYPLIIIKWAATWQNQQNECAPSEDSDQPGHPPSLIRVFAVRMKKPWILSYPMSAQRRLWSDWADAQADLSLRWAHTHFVGFVMSWLKYPPYLFHWILKILLFRRTHFWSIFLSNFWIIQK